MYDVEVLNGPGWATDLSTGSRRYACDRAHELAARDYAVRVLDRRGDSVNFSRGAR